MKNDITKNWRRMKILKILLKCWICDNDYVDDDDKVRDHCHITGKYHKEIVKSILKLIHDLHIVFHSLKYYGYHFIMQKLG